MRKIAEKVALVAQICVAIVFVITALLYVLGVIPQNSISDNAVVLVVMAVLALLFLGTSAYLVYMNFSELQNLKRILLYADSKSATTTNARVVNKIAKSCADKIQGVHVKKTKIRADEKQGYTATFVVEVSAPSVTPVLEQLRCLVDDCFRQTLGLVFNTITFEVAKLKNTPVTDVAKAKRQAEQITESAQESQQNYQNPTGENATDTVVAEQIVEDIADESPAETPIDDTPADEDVVADEEVADDEQK